MVEGSSGGTITNMDGKFSISLPKNKTSLKFSYVGFATQTVSVKNKKEVRVVMHEDLQQLDEVVVVGYGVQQKSHLSGSVTKVNMDGIEDVPTPRLDRALLGKVVGVQILNTTSEVGSRSGYIHSRYFFIQCQQQSADYRRRLPGERRS